MVPVVSVQEYLAYLDDHLKIGTVSLPVHARAVRNCPWDVQLWCEYLRALERYESPLKEVTAVFEQALASGFGEPAAYLELWLTFIDYKRRATDFLSAESPSPSMLELRAVFERARLHLQEVGGDPEDQVAKYQANLEADQYGSMDVCRQIWAVILQGQPPSATLWLEFVHLEKTYGDKKHLRKAYQRAVEKVHHQPELVTRSFLQFEREEGSLEAWEAARRQCRAKLARVEGRQGKEKEKERQEEVRRLEKVELKKEKDKQYRRDKRQEEAAAKKRSLNGATNTPLFKMPLAATKAPVEAPPGFKPPPGFQERKRAVEPPPGFQENQAKRQKLADPVSDAEFEGMTEVICIWSLVVFVFA